MSKVQSGRDRAVQIELLRARAAIERQSVAHGLHDLRESLTPRGLLESVFPRSKRKSPTQILLQAATLSRRYPMLLSLGSALFSASTRRRMRWWKLAVGAFVAWRVANRGRGSS